MSFVRRCLGPVSRRSFLQVGSLGMGGLGLADLLRLQAQAKTTAPGEPDPAVIFVWLPGGPPHMETYDMKPNAPEENRGIFKPIHTNVPGIDVCELLPLHAKIADKFTLIRSCAHEFADHGGGHKRFMTGRFPKEPAGFVNDFPAAPSVVAKKLEHRTVGLPNYVNIVDGGRQQIDTFSFGSAYLGSSTHPFVVGGDPSDSAFKINNLAPQPELAGRLDDRMTLLKGLDSLRRSVDTSGLMSSMDEFNVRAMDLITSDKARRAFDLSLEPEKMRSRYGKHAWGQRALMARRLVEAGCSFVTVVMENPTPSQSLPDNCVYNWDSHAVNCHMFEDLKFRAPYYDQAITALVEDLHDRGLTRKVLVVVTGEFGRTPRVSTQIGSRTRTMQPGRDHWPSAMSMLVCGGGMRTGQVVGSTNAKGEHPHDRPLSPNDLWATVYQHLGVDYEQSFPDYSGRPMPILPFGEPIRELL